MELRPRTALTGASGQMAFSCDGVSAIAMTGFLVPRSLRCAEGVGVSVAPAATRTVLFVQRLVLLRAHSVERFPPLVVRMRHDAETIWIDPALAIIGRPK